MSKYILFDTPLSDMLILLNAVFCVVIVARLFFFQRDGATHRKWGGWLAYVLIVVYASFPIRLAFGHIVIVDWSSIVVNGIICVALLKLRGNVVQLFKLSR